jgi:cytidylate kinase
MFSSPVALDDDIAGADGINAAIARNFTIDYLDTEHLYRIVDANIFPKYRHMAPLLARHLPEFQGSDAELSLERTAVFVALPAASGDSGNRRRTWRLYAPEFALLSFTSEAATKS